MVDGFRILIWNRIKKTLAIDLSGAGKGLSGGDSGGDITNVQYQPTWNCYNEFPLYN